VNFSEAELSGKCKANQSTDWLQTLGQTQFLSQCGLPVACSSASLPIYDAIFTHLHQKEDKTLSHSFFYLHFTESMSILNKFKLLQKKAKSCLILMANVGRGTGYLNAMGMVETVGEYF
jgi:DNA mismatch repair ATPase MutS